MKYFLQIQGYKTLALMGIFIWLYGSWTGGWGAEPQSNFEGYTDSLGQIMIFWGLLGDVFKDVRIEWNKITELKGLNEKDIEDIKKIFFQLKND